MKSIASDPHPNALTENISTSCTLYVCTSCRTVGTPREPREERQGYILYHELKEAISSGSLGLNVNVKATKCLSICPRPCGIAISTPGKWTYLFGDQNPRETVHDIIDCVATYLKTTDGFMERSVRPKSLRRSILGRVPPIQGLK